MYVWNEFYSEHWPLQMPSTFSQASGVRESYLARRTALRQFKFVDPLAAQFHTDAKPFNHLLLDKNNDIIFSQVYRALPYVGVLLPCCFSCYIEFRVMVQKHRIVVKGIFETFSHLESGFKERWKACFCKLLSDISFLLLLILTILKRDFEIFSLLINDIKHFYGLVLGLYAAYSCR